MIGGNGTGGKEGPMQMAPGAFASLQVWACLHARAMRDRGP